ncbi:MAG: universal stress protein [Alphaproteobacteria bacterium]|nr:universal stress protein [Alphaproteobacteria bacterium]
MALEHLIRRILVSVDTAPSARDRTGWAASLADAFGAELTGVAAARPLIPSYSPLGDELLAYQPQIIEEARRRVEAAVGIARTNFEAANAPRAAWKSSLETDAVPFLLHQAGAADAIVLGRNGTGDACDAFIGVDPGDVILQLGRPLLVVPPSATRFSAARVAIAWKSSRESRRAVADALPFLARADEVFVCAVGGDEAGPEAAAVVAYLSAHGLGAKAVAEPRHGRADSDAVFEIAERVDATLLVAGAYGRSRFKEWVFGGVTRDILDHTPIPCLLSH